MDLIKNKSIKKLLHAVLFNYVGEAFKKNYIFFSIFSFWWIFCVQINVNGLQPNVEP